MSRLRDRSGTRGHTATTGRGCDRHSGERQEVTELGFGDRSNVVELGVVVHASREFHLRLDSAGVPVSLRCVGFH